MRHGNCDLLETEMRGWVRGALEEFSRRGSSTDLEQVLQHLAADADPGVRERAAAAYASLLLGSSAIQRARLVADWCTAPGPRVRAVVAMALANGVPVLGASAVLQRLASDPSVEVRQAAAIAATRRLEEGPTQLVPLLELLWLDTAEEVRQAASAGLRRAAELGLTNVSETRRRNVYSPS